VILAVEMAWNPDSSGRVSSTSAGRVLRGTWQGNAISGSQERIIAEERPLVRYEGLPNREVGFSKAIPRRMGTKEVSSEQWELHTSKTHS
jgi:hypothetical protein